MGDLSDHEIDARLTGGGWGREDGALRCERSFPNFEKAMLFVNQVAEAAEAANHHPDILVHDYNKVGLTLRTHSANAITEADLALAARIDGLS